MADGKKDEAFGFIKNVMTLKGIMAGPNGQPAMYEVRNGNFNDPTVYGTVDKPQFLWAAGWYLYSLYHLFVVEENEWNITLKTKYYSIYIIQENYRKSLLMGKAAILREFYTMDTNYRQQLFLMKVGIKRLKYIPVSL